MSREGFQKISKFTAHWAVGCHKTVHRIRIHLVPGPEHADAHCTSACPAPMQPHVTRGGTRVHAPRTHRHTKLQCRGAHNEPPSQPEGMKRVRREAKFVVANSPLRPMDICTLNGYRSTPRRARTPASRSPCAPGRACEAARQPWPWPGTRWRQQRERGGRRP